MTKSGGGAATASGMDYQNRVAAWVATHILAEKDANPPWDFATETTLEWLRCETDQPVDDLMVGTSAKWLVFAQIKRTMQLTESESSDLASALDQFVRQLLACRTKTTGTQPWDRALDPSRDRLLLITSPSSSAPVRDDLREVLRKLKRLPQHQSFDQATVNDKERRALSVVLAHITRSWQKALGSAPSVDDLRKLFSLIQVHVLDLDGGNDEHQAKNLLRTAVLQNPDQADAAWALLVGFCAELAVQQSGAARFDFLSALEKAGLDIKAPRSYRNDIERLRQYSASTFGALAHLAEIRVGSTKVKLQRQCADALRQAAESDSILVVGDPGAGKSGVLHNLAATFSESGRDYILLAVDRLGAYSLGELRTEIGLDHDVVPILDNWPGQKPGFLIIDALDAARADPAGSMIRDLIRQVVQANGRWRVVVSIRKFDLRYGVEIRNLFVGTPVANFDDHEFKAIRHLNVPRLSDDELSQIAAQSIELYALIRSASNKLEDILRVPFNLRLMAELLGGGVAADELTPVRTQLELLDRYWSYRVIRSDRHGDAREEVLRKASEVMVKARGLRADRSAVAESANSTYLHDLLSSHVLIEWQISPAALPDRSILAFSHNVLFDYTVARLLLRGTDDTVVSRLVHDPELAVVIRPSILLHFRHLWMVNNTRSPFWDLIFRIILADQIPEIGKLIGPAVAAELARGMSDLEALCTILDDIESANHSAAEQTLRHLSGALMAGVPTEVPFVGPGAGPWCQLLERVTRTMSQDGKLAYTVRPLLSIICDRQSELSSEQRVATGHTARRLLEFAWSGQSRDQWLVIAALQGVCRTFEGDPVGSATLIRHCLDLEHLLQYGFQEMPWLAQEVKRLIPLDLILVADIYRAAFGYQDTSREPTPMGQSQILSMISNRQQDYGMALYELAKVFPTFLELAPEIATSTLIAVIEAYVAKRHPIVSREEPEEIFDFAGRQAHLRTDLSAIWDAGDTYRHDDAIQMLDTFQKYLENLAKQIDAIEPLRSLVQLITSENRLAVIWRRILLIGASHPDTLGREILPLAWAVPILAGYDTSTPAGEFLKAVSRTLNHSECEQIERAILSIPDVLPADCHKASEHYRNRLLGCLTNLVTQEASRVLEELRHGNDVPPNDPPVTFEEWSGPFGEEEYLALHGVSLEAEPNRKIWNFARPVKEFAEKHLNSTPTLEDCAALLPSLQMLYESLSQPETESVPAKHSEQAWGHLAAACARIARNNRLTATEPAGLFVKDVLLQASAHVAPEHDPEYDAQFDETPSWGSPKPRLEAAEGLIFLASNQSIVNPEVIKAIERLSSDRVPAVRFLIARGLQALYRTAPELMWQLIEQMSGAEASRGVLQGLLSGAIQGLLGTNEQRCAELTKTIFDRVSEGPGAKAVRQFCVGIFATLYIWRGHNLSREIIDKIAANPADHPDEVSNFIPYLRSPVTNGPTSPQDPNQDAVRHRALQLLEHILRSALAGLREIEQRTSQVPSNDWTLQDRNKATSVARIIDQVGSEVYFASGAYDNIPQKQPYEGKSLVRQQAERFYREAQPILNVLADAGLPSVTHHLLQTLEFFIPFDPESVFLYIGRVIQAGQQGRYQYEPMAAELIVKLVERYLAEYRTILRENVQCRQIMIEILDVFVRVGWPSAQRLTYRLEEIYR